MSETRFNKRHLIGSILVCVAVVAGYQYFVKGKKQGQMVAEQAWHAVLDGDAKTLYNYSMPKERAAAGLTEGKISALWKELVLPRFSKFSPKSGLSTQELRGSGQFETTGYLVDAQGHQVELQATPFPTDAGYQGLILPYLRIAWFLEYGVGRGLPVTAKTFHQSIIEGIDHDLPELHKLGISQFAPYDDDKPMTWEQYREILKKTG